MFIDLLIMLLLPIYNIKHFFINYFSFPNRKQLLRTKIKPDNGLQLLLCGFSQKLQSLLLWQALFYQDSVVTFKIGKNKEMVQVSIITNISLFARIFLAPVFCCFSKQGNIQQISFISIDIRLLRLCKFRQNQMLFDSIRVDSVIQF